MFSAMQPIPELENKSLQIRELFAKTANEKLAKGLTESEAIFSALQVVSSYERANRPKPAKNQIAPHLKAILDAAIAKKHLGSQESTEPVKTPINASQQYSKFIKKNTLSPDSERSLISASWTDDARLVLEFDDGEKITTDAAPVAEVIQNIAVGVNQSATLPEQYEHIQFNTASTSENAVGRLVWNDVDGTLNLGLKGGNVTLQLGQEELIHIYNHTSMAFNDLQVIRVTGSQGQGLTAALAQADSELTSSSTLAVVTEHIAKNAEGFATVSGLVRNVNTSMFAEGAALYLSPTVAGGLTTTKPTAPNHMVMIGWVVRSNANNGIIYVSITNGFELEELHNVKLDDLQDKDVLTYESASGLWKNKPATQTDKQEVYIGVPTILPLHPALVFEQVVIEGQTVYRMKVSDGII